MADPVPNIDDLQAEVETLRAQVAELKSKPNAGFTDEQIGEKVRAGLSRDQAIEVLLSQRENDARIAKEEAAKAAPEEATKKTAKKPKE